MLHVACVRPISQRHLRPLPDFCTGASSARPHLARAEGLHATDPGAALVADVHAALRALGGGLALQQGVGQGKVMWHAHCIAAVQGAFPRLSLLGIHWMQCALLRASQRLRQRQGSG